MLYRVVSSVRQRAGSRAVRVMSGSAVLAVAAVTGFAGTQAGYAAVAGHGLRHVAIRGLRSASSVLGKGGCGGGAEIAFQANTGNLWAVGEDQAGDLGYGMMAGTSPAITCLTGGGYEVAFQANTGNLWTVGQDGHGDWGTPMMAGTSPAIAALSGGGYEVAFQGSNGDAWTAGPDGVTDYGTPMAPGTSPAITGQAGGGYQYAFQGSNGYLWIGGNGGRPFYQNLSVRAGTSPAMATLGNGTTVIAWQESNGCLDIITTGLTSCLGNVGADSSPSITATNDPTGYMVAFHDMWSNWVNTYFPGAGVTSVTWGLPIMGGTSPSATILPDGSLEMASQDPGTDLRTGITAPNSRDWGLGMMPGTSPSISS
jgi:hypothetical protein